VTISESEFDALAAKTLERIMAVVDDEDPDVVEAIPSSGVVRLDFQGRRQPWIVNSQRAALQIWVAAERRAWHFAYAGDGEVLRWKHTKSDDELFATLEGLLSEHAGVSVEF
jgi:CyaY protein